MRSGGNGIISALLVSFLVAEVSKVVKDRLLLPLQLGGVDIEVCAEESLDRSAVEVPSFAPIGQVAGAVASLTRRIAVVAVDALLFVVLPLPSPIGEGPPRAWVLVLARIPHHEGDLLRILEPVEEFADGLSLITDRAEFLVCRGRWFRRCLHWPSPFALEDRDSFGRDRAGAACRRGAWPRT